MKTPLKALSIVLMAALLLIANSSIQAQADTTRIVSPDSSKNSKLEAGLRFGYDLPLFDLPFESFKYSGGLYISPHIDFTFKNSFAFRGSYDYISSTPSNDLTSTVDAIAGPLAVSTQLKKLNRHNILLGPGFRTKAGKKARLSLFVLGGYSLFRKGDLYALGTTNTGGMQDLMVHTGFTEGAWSGKIDVSFDFQLSPKLHLALGAYYVQHFGVNFDRGFEFAPYAGSQPWYHASESFTTNTAGNSEIIPASSVSFNHLQAPEHACADLSSIGLSLGLSYTFGEKKKPIIPKKDEAQCPTCCPNDKHKVIVTVLDRPTGKPIPGADALIRDLNGNPVAAGITNGFGVVDFGELPHGNYTTVGLVYGVETTITAIADAEFFGDTTIQKKVYYEDLRFILKGVTRNLTTKANEPNVLVSLTQKQTQDVTQNNSDAYGTFAFRLDPASSYEVVGNKANRLSEIEAVTTIGLNRSATLFVELELGVQVFECAKGVVLDIKYEFDDDRLSPTSRFELDRLVRYMKDHNLQGVELSSHTDSRGTNEYNQGLSQRRAQSAVGYIVSQGIPRASILARGYGETQLLNNCRDGINCDESEHLINRRTEARLICN